jgi:hypothetical protein
VEEALVADISPEGTVWWCTQCGRIAADKQGRMAALGWTKECTQHAVLVLEGSMKVDETGRVVQAALVSQSGQGAFPGEVNEVKIASRRGTRGLTD